MASPIENNPNIKVMTQTVKAVRDSAVVVSGSQQGQSIQPDEPKVEKVAKSPSNSSLNFEDITQKLKDNEYLKETITKMLEGFKDIYDGDSLIGNRAINFDFDDKTGDVVVKIVDKNSQEVIRQIPPEEMLRIIARLRNYSEEVGLLIDTEA